MTVSRWGNNKAPTVLLINDTPELRRLKRLILERSGYTVVEILDGQLALEYLHASAVPLVVVMNTHIRGLDAAGLLGAAAGEPRLKRHAFVLTTALANQLPDELLELMQELQALVVGKPFTKEDLLTAVANAVERTQAYARHNAGDHPPGTCCPR